jgi:hypothetical protein
MSRSQLFRLTSRWISTALPKSHRSLRLPPSCPSLLESIKKANNVSLPRGPFNKDPKSLIWYKSKSYAESEAKYDKERLVPFFLENGKVVGFLRPQVFEALSLEKDLFLKAGGISFKYGVDEGARTAYMNDLVGRWKKEGLFAGILRGV